MDLKALRAEAVNEVNADLREERIDQFKTDVRNKIKLISQNNEAIQNLQIRNDELRRDLSALELDEFTDVTLF